jgi:LPXTG-motif cell wall-anchored protein
LPSNGGTPVLLIYSDSGMKFETSALPIPALDTNTARETKLILNQVGSDYYINKIWVQGKDYGYELPIPASMKSRQNEKVAETTVPARSQSTVDTETVQVATDSNADKAQDTTPATANTVATTATETAILTEKPSTEPDKPSTDKPLIETARLDEPAAQAAAQPKAEPVAPASSDNSADRAMTDQTPASTPAPAELPKTAAGWLTLLLGGGALSGAGLMLRRKR